MRDKPYRTLFYLLFRLAVLYIRLWPRPVALAQGRVLGTIAYYLLARDRYKALAHLTLAYGPRYSETDRRRIARGLFTHWGHILVDLILFSRLDSTQLREIVEIGEELKKADVLLAKGCGLIVLSGHIGHWELLAATFCLLGRGGGVVSRRARDERFDRLLVAIRRHVRVETIYRDASPKEMLAILKQGKALGVVPDQDVDSIDGLFLDFLGRPAYTPTGPAKLALASGAPILPGFMIREGNRYRLMIEAPIFPERFGKGDHATRAITEAWSRVVERYVNTYPDQWAWTHNRWKTQPSQAQNGCGDAERTQERTVVHS